MKTTSCIAFSTDILSNYTNTVDNPVDKRLIAFFEAYLSTRVKSREAEKKQKDSSHFVNLYKKI